MVFIDDVMIAIETEKGHNEIVEEVLRRLEENDLFVKPVLGVTIVQPHSRYHHRRNKRRARR